MKYIKFITLSVVLLIVLIVLFAIMKIWGITLPEGWNMTTQRLPHSRAVHRGRFEKEN